MVIIASLSVSSCATAVRTMVESQSDEDIRSFLDAGGPERLCKVIKSPSNYGERTIAVAQQAVRDEGLGDCSDPHRTKLVAVAGQPAAPIAVRTTFEIQSDNDIRSFLDDAGPIQICAVIKAPEDYAPRTIVVARQLVKDEGISDCNNPRRSAPIAAVAQPQPAAPVNPPTPTPPLSAKPVESGSSESDQFAKHIRAYIKAKDCNAHAYTLTKFDLELLSLEAEGDFEVEKQTADITLDFGDTAAEKGCVKQAREIYTSVITRFVGIGYSAYRERAKIGLDDLRGK